MRTGMQETELSKPCSVVGAGFWGVSKARGCRPSLGELGRLDGPCTQPGPGGYGPWQQGLVQLGLGFLESGGDDGPWAEN